MITITKTKTKSLNFLKFLPRSSEINKQILIKMAKEGEPRPEYRTEKGRVLSKYTHKSSTYDESFTKLIKKLRPDWFVKPSDLMKQKLIKMAKDGKDKPKQITKEGMLFSSYTLTCRSSYDESFTKLIKKLRPDWFVKSSDLMKQKLIKMAKEDNDRPRYKTKEGQALASYIYKSSDCYDKSFTKKIRKLRPDWFRK